MNCSYLIDDADTSIVANQFRSNTNDIFFKKQAIDYHSATKIIFHHLFFIFTVDTFKFNVTNFNENFFLVHKLFEVIGSLSESTSLLGLAIIYLDFLRVNIEIMGIILCW